MDFFRDIVVRFLIITYSGTYARNDPGTYGKLDKACLRKFEGSLSKYTDFDCEEIGEL